MDANNDGTLDKQEVMAYRMQRRRDRVMHTFEYLDKNKDQKISKDEARGLWADNFDQLDTNHDGFLDEKEIDAAYDLKYKADADKKMNKNNSGSNNK
jgi:Ca2+-binding EF-hand superfamily protein